MNTGLAVISYASWTKFSPTIRDLYPIIRTNNWPRRNSWSIRMNGSNGLKENENDFPRRFQTNTCPAAQNFSDEEIMLIRDCCTSWRRFLGTKVEGHPRHPYYNRNKNVKIPTLHKSRASLSFYRAQKRGNRAFCVATRDAHCYPIFGIKLP